VLNGVNVAKLSPADAVQAGPFMDLARNLASFLTQTFEGPLESLRLSVQGAIPASSHRALTVAMIVGALRSSVSGTLTTVNAERIAEERNVRVHFESSDMKRDFVSLLRVEALIGGTRHIASGTVLGQRHGRIVELDDYILDAIPEGPLLVTFHKDEPGVVGKLGTLLADAGCNISRMQIGTGKGKDIALGVLNITGDLPDGLRDKVQSIASIVSAHVVL
jgi:D-3-phosphoglycerate dehydrogenase